jgi:hypothetical protein
MKFEIENEILIRVMIENGNQIYSISIAEFMYDITWRLAWWAGDVLVELSSNVSISRKSVSKMNT